MKPKAGACNQIAPKKSRNEIGQNEKSAQHPRVW